MENGIQYRRVKILIELSAEMNRQLSESAIRSERSKTQEAKLRLQDHLINIDEIASIGKSFHSK